MLNIVNFATSCILVSLFISYHFIFEKSPTSSRVVFVLIVLIVLIKSEIILNNCSKN